MLVLNLKKGHQVSIGEHLLEVIVIYESSAYIMYKGKTCRIANGLTKVDPDLDMVFKKRNKLSVKLGFSSPFPIWRVPNEY